MSCMFKSRNDTEIENSKMARKCFSERQDICDIFYFQLLTHKYNLHTSSANTG